MLDRKSGEMRIGDKIAVQTGQREQFGKNVGVSLGRLRYPSRFAGEPRPHLLPSSLHRKWAHDYSRICDKTQKSEQGEPRHSDGNGAAQLGIEPFLGGGILAGSGVYRVEGKY